MFKMGLLTSSAMTAVALLLSGAAQAQTDMHVASSDPNVRFLCTYGQYDVSATSGRGTTSSCYRGSSRWSDVAVPIVGHGQTVSSIRVIEVRDSRSSTPAFTVGIYKNSPSGLPSNPIAVGTGKAHRSCGPVDVSIPRTTLKSNKTYWIEEQTSTANKCRRSMWGGTDAHRREFRPSVCVVDAILAWKIDPNTKRKAYTRLHVSSSSSGSTNYSYTGRWSEHSTGPYVRLR